MVKKVEKFEDALKRLEEIVETLENEDVSLDECVKLFEEGVELSKFCRKKLNQVEDRIKKLSKNLDNEFSVEDFRGDTD